jgi:hypothetical protein
LLTTMWLALVSVVVASAPISIRVGEARANGVDGAIAHEWLDRVATQLQRNGAVRLVQSQGEGLLEGEVAQVDAHWKVAVAIRRTRDGSVWATAAGDFSSEDAAQEWLEDAALDLEVDLRPSQLALQRVAPAPSAPTWVRLLPGVAGLALGAGAATSLIMSAERSVRIRMATDLSAEGTTALQREQKTLEVTGAVLAGAAAVGLASTVVWFGATNTVITVAPSTSGANVSVSGRF